MLTKEQIQQKVNSIQTQSTKIQWTESKVLVWHPENGFIFEANKLGEFWYVKGKL